MDRTKNIVWLSAFVVFNLSILLLVSSYHAIYLKHSSFDQAMSSYLIIDEPEYIRARDLPVNFSHFFNYGYVQFPEIKDVVNPVISQTIKDSFLGLDINFTQGLLSLLLAFLIFFTAIVTLRFIRLRKLSLILYPAVVILGLQIAAPFVISGFYGKNFTQRQEEFMSRVHGIKDQPGMVKFSARETVHEYQVEDKEMFNEIVMKIKSDFDAKDSNLLGNYSFLIILADAGIAGLSIIFFFIGFGLKHGVIWLGQALNAVAVRRYIASKLLLGEPTLIVSPHGALLVKDQADHETEFRREVLGEMTFPQFVDSVIGSSNVQAELLEAIKPTLMLLTWQKLLAPGAVAAQAFVDRNVETFDQATQQARQEVELLPEYQGADQAMTKVSRLSTQATFTTWQREFKNILQPTLARVVSNLIGRLNERLTNVVENQSNAMMDTDDPIANGIKYMRRRGNRTCIVVETPPGLRTLMFNQGFLSHDSRHGGGYDYKQYLDKDHLARFYLELPFVIFLLCFEDSRLTGTYAFYRNEPLTSLDDVLRYYNLPNYSREFRGQVCMGGAFHSTARTINGKVRQAIDYYWQSHFNDHWTHSYDACRQAHPGLRNVVAWQQMSDQEPGFMCQVNWAEAGTVRSYIEQYFQGARGIVDIDTSEVVRQTLTSLGDDLIRGLRPLFEQYRNGYSVDEATAAVLDHQLDTIRQVFLRQCRDKVTDLASDLDGFGDEVNMIAMQCVNDAVEEGFARGFEQLDLEQHFASSFSELLVRIRGH